ncbi:helix-turn-helix domain-containing protein [Polynucleobacter rarus]|jgi:transcriptional regulator with XRE-family HTH domain|uniref:helix-turn-helix domain-containing protein n=1 Tax=Polynucleobacter rarus TaxID=556055 RepID=UPI000D3E6F94|nr:helix-turn-helix transcriptional regulator [Polynucleobacter rarus]
MELNEIGALIKEARKSKGLSQEAVGKSLGMSRATISGIETGKIAEVGFRKTMMLCAVLGLEINVSPRRKYPTLQELRKENNAKKRD